MGTVNESTYVCLRIVIRGAVQGVGFRPFVYRLAGEMKLNGRVMNTASGVVIEAEGEEKYLKEFFHRILSEKPPRAVIQSIEHWFLDPSGWSGFAISESDGNGKPVAVILPDIATCPDCQREIFDSTNRRYLYPFTNCTNCGPRFSIITSLPYDRANTTMSGFTMCPECLREYSDPRDRRFHAQPNACPQCGPRLELWNTTGNVIQTNHRALLAAADEILSGKIVAMKGLGGFQLLVDARYEEAVRRLRVRKQREEKPLALMFPSMQMIKECCEVSPEEERMLISPESPIVLMRRKKDCGVVAANIAPSNPSLGVMLPYTPLHHILMCELDIPVVATSGNISDEPICTDEREAVKRLKGIADIFLVHNRPIRRHVDDSVARIILGREQILRRARGYAPLPIAINHWNKRPPLIAVGAHVKNTIALSVGENIMLSQHIGDLGTAEAFHAFTNAVDDFKQLYKVSPEKVLCDAHPEYLSGKYARSTAVKVEEIQHHYAHVASCMAENRLDGSVLGVSWDGTGFGTDGTIWGGEFFLTTKTSFERVATFAPFPLPGGEQAIREPRRAALGLLYEIFGESLFEKKELFPLLQFSGKDRIILRAMLAHRINTPLTTSVGRLFDAVASIINLRHYVSFEGQAAMEMEFLAGVTLENNRYRCEIVGNHSLLQIDWRPMVLEILNDVQTGVCRQSISTKFHNTISGSIIEIAKRIGEKKVVLSGGCFQNRYLTERTVMLLRHERFQPYWHQRVPTNDGGIALGQIYASIRKNKIDNAVDQVFHHEESEEISDVSWNSR